MAQLHEIWPGKSKSIYCGPAVLCALTGIEGHTARGWVNGVRGRPSCAPVLGVSNVELLGALASRGYAARKIELPFGPTSLERFASDIAKPGEFYIVNVTRHYVSLLDGVAADNWHRFGSPVSEHPHRRKHVQHVWQVAS